MSTTSAQPAGTDAAFPPPPGVIPDLQNPATHLRVVNIVGMATCVGFLASFYFLRCYARWKLSLPTRQEDLALHAAWVLTVFYISTCFMMARYGEGYHAWELTVQEYRSLLKWLYISSIIWIPTAFFAKASLLLLMARVFAVYERASKGIIYYTWFIFVAYLPVQFVKIFICTPIKHYWNSSIPGTCLDQPKIFLTDTAMAIITDFVILVLPVFFIWRLRMSLRKKLKIAAMLGAGGAAVAVACYREYCIYVFQWSTDVSGDFVRMNLCGSIEITIGVVCACLPPINLLMERRNKDRNKIPSPLRSRVWPSSGSPGRRGKGSSKEMTAYWHSWVSRVTRTGSQTTRTRRESDGIDVDVDVEVATSGALRTEAGDGQGPREMDEVDAHMHDMGINMQELLRHKSSDGRREGWLADEGRRPELVVQTDVVNASMPGRAAVTLEQLRRDPREILTPDRIWDGQSLNLGADGSGSSSISPSSISSIPLDTSHHIAANQDASRGGAQ